MKNKILKSLMMVLFALVLVIITGCTEQSDEIGYVMIETNPSIELIVKNDIVVSVNGLNDEGKMLIIDEKFVDKSVEDATKHFINLSEQLGYTIKGKVDTDAQLIKISVGGSLEKEKLSILEMKVNETAQKAIYDLGLNAKSEIIQQKTKEYFVAIVMKYDPTLTKEEVSAMDYKDLMNIVNLATLEKAEIFSIKLEEYYEQMKEYEFKLKYKQELASSLGEGYQELLNSYNELLVKFSESINDLQLKKVEFFTSPNSNYVKAIQKYNEVKSEFLKSKIDVQIAINNGKDTTLLKVNMQIKEDAVKAADAVVTAAESTINFTFESLISVLEGIYLSLEKLEKDFPKEINFEEKLSNAENYMNTTKREMFEKFESSVSKERIEEIKSNLKLQKENLKKAVTEAKK